MRYIMLLLMFTMLIPVVLSDQHISNIYSKELLYSFGINGYDVHEIEYIKAGVAHDKNGLAAYNPVTRKIEISQTLLTYSQVLRERTVTHEIAHHYNFFHFSKGLINRLCEIYNDCEEYDNSYYGLQPVNISEGWAIQFSKTAWEKWRMFG